MSGPSPCQAFDNLLSTSQQKAEGDIVMTWRYECRLCRFAW